ncbi:MAG: hypothetical protein P8R36_00585 [Actinomycetota bacterium]|nr:hypothetical protein [Actinomycetota bacterium]MDG1488762.1 hypothetical protein [Actinomycetota bacterium]MDG2120294.1 hypothetical protein [Actinomycetota bacterium]
MSLQQGEATAEEFLLLLGGFSCSEICYIAAVTANATACDIGFSFAVGEHTPRYM